VNVATPQYVEIEHIGGPYDGETQRIACDADGRPPEFYVLTVGTSMDFSVPAHCGPQAKRASQFYDLDTVIDEDGPRYVYRWRGETVTDITGGPGLAA
jgi:hypothetical protein